MQNHSSSRRAENQDENQAVSPSHVAAVVVTRNRLPLLQRCVQALKAQTRPLDAIYVIDVVSTDETPAYLRSEAAPVQTVRLETNAGGAGGFHAGIDRAFEDGFSWIWCMDDDGYAAPDALEKLLRVVDPAPDEAKTSEIEPHFHQARWANSLVVRQDDPKLLAFPFQVSRDRWVENTAEMIEMGLCVPNCCPFNGTLIHRSVVDAIGSPHPDLFIWGDEQEYKRRAAKAGFGIITVTDSLFYHPASNSTIIPAVPIRSFWKYFYHVRNNGASATKDGQLKLSAGGSYALGRAYIKTLLLSMISNNLKILIVLAAMLAARANNTKRFYPK